MMKKSELIAALAAIPGAPEILVQSAEVGFNSIAAVQPVTVQRLNPNQGGLGAGDFVTAENIIFLRECEAYRTEPRQITAEAPFDTAAIFSAL